MQVSTHFSNCDFTSWKLLCYLPDWKSSKTNGLTVTPPLIWVSPQLSTLLPVPLRTLPKFCYLSSYKVKTFWTNREYSVLIKIKCKHGSSLQQEWKYQSKLKLFTRCYVDFMKMRATHERFFFFKLKNRITLTLTLRKNVETWPINSRVMSTNSLTSKRRGTCQSYLIVRRSTTVPPPNNT